MSNLGTDLSTVKYPAHEEQVPDISKLLEDPFEILGIKQFPQIVDGFCMDLNQYCQQNGIFLTKLMQGQGSFGRVYQVPSLATVEMSKYAGKLFSLVHQYNVSKIVNEFQIQFDLNKLYPEKYLYFKAPILIQQAYPNHLYNILATLESGRCNLYQYLKEEPNISEYEYLGIFYQILDSIVAMHKHHYAHRDIKPQNIIYVQQKGWLLADFGCAQKYEQNEDEYEIVGTKAFNYEEIRNQINKQQQIVKINLVKNDLYAFCLTMLMVKYPKQTISESYQMIENKLIEDSQLNQILNLLDDKELLMKIEQLLPLQYEQIQPQLDQNKIDSYIVCDKEVISDDTNNFDYLTGRGVDRLKQKIYMDTFVKVSKSTSKPKDFELILNDPLSDYESMIIPVYLTKVEQYTKLKEVLPKCFKLGYLPVKIYELFANISLNNYNEAFNVSNEIEQKVNQLTFMDKAIFYLMKNYLILQQKGEKWIEILDILMYIEEYFKGWTQIFIIQIVFRQFQCHLKYGIDLYSTLQIIINVFETTKVIEEQNLFCYLKSKCYYMLSNFSEAKSSMTIFLERKNPKKLNAKEFLNQLIQESTDPVVIERSIYQIADCQFILNNYSLCCEFYFELISFCESKSIKIQYQYYMCYGMSLFRLELYDKALHILKLTSFLDCTNNEKILLLWTEAIINFHLGLIEQSKSNILSLLEIFQQNQLKSSYRIQILNLISQYLELLIQKLSIQLAKQIYEMTQNSILNNYENILTEEQLSTLYQKGINIYMLLFDNLSVRLTLKKIVKIQKERNSASYQQNKLLLFWYSIKAYELAIGNKLENQQKTAYYYQKYINFLKTQPLDSQIVNVYKQFINFYQQINHPGVIHIVESYAAFMIENFEFEDSKTVEALAMLEIYK